MHKPHLVTGLRPTGPLHIGHYAGTLEPLLRVQGAYESFVFIADYHALISLVGHAADLPRFSRLLAAEFLASGVDPEQSHIFVQSQVPEHLELAYILSTLAPIGALERTPHYKEKVAQGHTATLALLGYPVLQAADIAVYRGQAVPVGEDQVPHLELSRELVRRIGRVYPGVRLPEPQPVLSRISRLRGLDGEQKMSKSVGNTIELGHPPQETEERMRRAVTDPQRVTRDIPGRPEICTVYQYYEAFAPAAAPVTAHECRNALRGCVECKAEMAGRLNAFLAPLRERRTALLEDPRPVDRALAAGAEVARQEAGRTLAEVKEAMGLRSPIGAAFAAPAVPITAP